MGSGCRRRLRAFSIKIGKALLHERTTDLGSMISYPNYKFCFPIKALGMYAHLYGDEAI